MEEKLRIKKILQGDIPEFSYFVEAYQDMAITIAYRICNNMQDAEDIVQDSFVKAFHNLSSFRFGSKFSTWFYRIVHNTAITFINSSIYTSEFVGYSDLKEEQDDWDMIEQMDREEKKNMLEKALKELPVDYSLILTLFYLEENPVKDIVRITGLTETNVKVKLHRARKQLSDILRVVISEKTY